MNKLLIIAGIFLLTGGLKILLKTTLISVLPFSIWISIAFCILIYDLIKYYKKEYNEDSAIIDEKVQLPPKPLAPVKELAE